MIGLEKHEKREHRANAYLCDKFYAGVITTSRCEGINSSLKKFIRFGNCLFGLVENLDRVVKDYRNNEFMANFKSLYSDTVMTIGLESIEKAISKVYTWEIFFELRNKSSHDGDMYKNALSQVAKLSKKIEAVCPQGGKT
ncbi:hypothetical protein AHAS_Ahas19G0215400 [Arachis hypogaea]